MSRNSFINFYSGYQIFYSKNSPGYTDFSLFLSGNVFASTTFNSDASYASIVVPDYSLGLAKKLLNLNKFEKLLTVTIRNSRYDKLRNSPFPEWAKFVHYAIKLGYRVVVLPDTENSLEFDPISPHLVYNEFIYNVELRAALYQISQCNLGVANWPMTLSTLNPLAKSTLMFKIAPKGSELASEFINSNINPDDPRFYYNSCTVNLTLDDTFENIKNVFNEVFRKNVL